MNEMVERVARALEASFSKDYQRVLLDQPALSIRGTPEELASVAIAAMRTPTAAMMEAGESTVTASEDGECWEMNAADSWQAMIDAALAD